MTEILKTGRVNLFSFLGRRARRILPALISVSLFTLSGAWFFLLPEDFVDLAFSVVAAFFFVSNFYFYFETTEYGADNALLEPFLHTWSLAVEEQFYLVFPVFLISIFSFQRSRVVAWLICLSLASFAFALVFAKLNPDMNFFLPFSRAWELLAGALVAYRELQVAQNRKSSGRVLKSFTPVLCLCAIVASMFLVHSTDQHPGFVTIPVVLGTALLLALGTDHGFAGKLLTFRPFVAVGLISYSLYLWHFPIFAFGRLASVLPSPQEKLVWIVIASLLSIASYSFVEQPFRNRNLISQKTFLISYVLTLSSVFALCVAVVKNDGFIDRLPPELRPFTAKPGYRSLEVDGERCHSKTERFCNFEINPKASTTVILMGDSHADSLANDLYEKLKSLDVRSYAHITSGGCPVIIGFSIAGRKSCSPDVVQNRLEYILKMSNSTPTIVVYFARTPVYLTGERYNGGPGRVEAGPPFKHVISGDRETNLSNSLLQISKFADLIVVYPMPELGIHAPRYFMDRVRMGRNDEIQRVMKQEPLGISENLFRNRSAQSYKLLDALPIPDAHRIYPGEILCTTTPENWCTAHKDGQLLYADSNHPNWVLASEINEQIIQQIERMLPSAGYTENGDNKP